MTSGRRSGPARSSTRRAPGRRRGRLRRAASAALLAAASCASAAAPPADPAAALAKGAVVAVLPPENLAGSPAPLAEIRRALRAAIEARSIRVLGETALDAFLASRRIRHTGGLAPAEARALLAETGAAAALISSVELHEDSESPKVALTARLVSTGDVPTVLWMDSVALAADDAPGFLGLGLVRDVRILRDRAIGGLADGVAARLERGGAPGARTGDRPRAERRFRPRSFHRSPGADPAGSGPVRVAVMPFRSDVARADAGALVALQFVRRLAASPGVEVLEPGVVREVLLRARLVQSEGISLPQADLLRELLDADVVVAGRVDDWRDAPGTGTVPHVSFTAQGIDTRTRRVVWTATTGHRGDRGVFFFGARLVRTANALAAEMALAVVARAVPGPGGGAGGVPAPADGVR